MVKKISDSGVSPVIGVMLMLVVVIIIAAIVASFAAGMTENVEKASNAQIKLIGISSGGGVGGTTGPIGVVFQNSGGDSVDLRNLRYYMTGIAFGDTAWSSQGAFTITYNDPVSEAYVGVSRNGFVYPYEEARGYRMQKLGDGMTTEERNDPILESGERFIIFCEYYQPSAVPKLGFRADRGDTSTSTWSSGAIDVDGSILYTLSDMKTGVVYSSEYLGPEHIF